MNIEPVISKFERILGQIKENSNKFDIDLLSELVNQTSKNLEGCYKLDLEILDLLKDKNYFRTITDLNNFVKKVTGTPSRKRKRSEAETENTKILMKNSYTKDKLLPVLPTKIIKKVKKKKTSKTKPSSKETNEIMLYWINLTEEGLRKEFTKYTTVNDLKEVADSLFKGNDRRLRNRKKVETRIIERINEQRALFQLGK